MRKYSERSFKNLEFLRFFLIWAVVGVHIAYLNVSSFEEFSFLIPWTAGWQAVEMFFLMSGFFLFGRVNPEESFFSFASKKWLRLAPFIIVLTLLGYLCTGFNIMQYPLSVNIFNSLLLLDWNTHHFGPDATIIYVAWFANALFFVSIVYFCILKALPHERATLLIGAIAFTCFFMYNRHVYLVVPFIYPLVRAFAYIGFGYLLRELWKVRSENQLSGLTHGRYLLISALEIILCLTLTLSLFSGASGQPAPEGLAVPPEEIPSLTALTWFPELNRWAIDGVWLQIAFAALFWLFLCNKGIISRTLNCSLSVTLGRYSYAIFLVHTIVIRSIRDFYVPAEQAWCRENPYLFIFIVCLIITIAAVLAHHLIEMPLMKLVSSKK
mgnify:CR=1 FL=1